MSLAAWKQGMNRRSLQLFHLTVEGSFPREGHMSTNSLSIKGMTIKQRHVGNSVYSILVSTNRFHKSPNPKLR